MSDKITKSPQIRFAGFTDAWKQVKIKDCFTERSERSAEGELISVTINSGVVKASDLDRKDNSSSDKSNYKVVKVGDIAYNSMRMWQGASGFSPYDGILSPAYTVITPKENSNPKFFAYNFKRHEMIWTFQINSQGLTSDTWNLKFPALSAIKITVPSYEEQTEIARFFEKLDHQLALQQRELELLKDTKKSLLQKMFPKYGANIPEIRFAGFTDAWEQRELGDYIIQYSEVTTENNQYPVFTSSRKGLFFQTDYYDGNQIASEDNTGYNIVPRGYFTYRHMSDDLVFKFNINNLADNGIVSTLYPVFTTTESLDSTYLQYQLNEGEEFKRFAILQKQGGSRTYMYLSKLKNMRITMPKLDEQIKIGEFFKQLDDTIALHQRELNSLKNLKKSLFQQMFV